MTDQDELVPVGKIVGTHGVRGLLKLFSYSGNAQSLQAAKTVYLKGRDGSLRDFEFTRVSSHTTGFIIGFAGFTDINQVEFMIGSELCLKQSQLPALDEGEYYWRDLLGLTVITEQGVALGTIADIFETGSSDVYVVRGGDKEYLIPAIADVVAKVDISGRTMIITPLDGLLDL